MGLSRPTTTHCTGTWCRCATGLASSSGSAPFGFFDVIAWLDASGKGDELLMLRDGAA